MRPLQILVLSAAQQKSLEATREKKKSFLSLYMEQFLYRSAHCLPGCKLLSTIRCFSAGEGSGVRGTVGRGEGGQGGRGGGGQVCCQTPNWGNAIFFFLEWERNTKVKMRNHRTYYIAKPNKRSNASQPNLFPAKSTLFGVASFITTVQVATGNWHHNTQFLHQFHGLRGMRE